MFIFLNDIIIQLWSDDKDKIIGFLRNSMIDRLFLYYTWIIYKISIILSK